MSDLLPHEREIARARIRDWPVQERRALTRMTEKEVHTIALLTALLDIRPVEGIDDGNSDGGNQSR